MPPVLFSADVVCPMTGPPIAGGGVLVEGATVVAVGPAAQLRAAARREHSVDGVLLPGFVDAGTALEHADAGVLAGSRPGLAPDALRDPTGEWTDEQWSRSAHRGVLRALRAGTTTVCDVVTRGPAVPAASRAGLPGTSWVAVPDVDASTAQAVLDGLETALGLPAEGRRVGVAVPSGCRLSVGVLRRLAALATRCHAPLHLGCVDTTGEIPAPGPERGSPTDAALTAGGSDERLYGGPLSALRRLEALGALTDRTTLASGVELDAGEARLLARLGVGVVCSPRADAQRRGRPAPLERYAGAGTPLAVGTGGPATVDDLDVLAEAAAWARLAATQGLRLWPSAAGPVPVAEAAVRLATVDGARTVGWGAVAGVLEPGRRADLVGVAVDTTSDTVYRDLVERGPGRQVLTVVAGVRKARRDGPDDPWPPVDDDAWRR